MTWSQRVFTETIKVADVTLIINRRANTTKTVTNYIPIPDGYTMPPVDAAGSQIVTVTTDYDKSLTTVVTFPTGYTAYSSSYRWYGVLETTTSSEPACETAEYPGSYVTLPSHPQPGPNPMPTDISSYAHTKDTPRNVSIPWPSEGDTRGLYYTTYWVDIQAEGFLHSIFPTEKMFTECAWPSPVLPATQLLTAMLLTQTHTSYDDSAPTDTSENGGGGGGRKTPHLAHIESSVPPAKETDGGGTKGNKPPPSLGDVIQSVASAASASSAGSDSGGSGNGKGGNNGDSSSDSGSSNGGNNGQNGGNNNGGSGSSPQASSAIEHHGVTLTTDSSSNIVVSGQTLTPGSTVIVHRSDGPPVVVAVSTVPGTGGSGGGGQGGDDQTVLVVGGSTTTLPANAFAGGQSVVETPTAASSSGSGSSSNGNAGPAPQPIVVGSSTFTPDATAGGATPSFIIGGQTLAPSSPITLGSGSSATTISLTTNAAGDEVVVINGASSTFAPAPTSSSFAVGDFIISGLGGSIGSSAASDASADGEAQITAAIFTFSAGAGTGDDQVITAVEVGSGTFVIPPTVSGGQATTISPGGSPVTLTTVEDGKTFIKVVSAEGSGLVVVEGGKTTTVGASTTEVAVGPTGSGGAQQFQGAAIRLGSENGLLVGIIMLVSILVTWL